MIKLLLYQECKKQILALSATEKHVYIKNTSVCDTGAPRPRGS